MRVFSKKIISLVSVLVLEMTMVGCSAGGNCNPTPNPTVTPSPSPTVTPSPDPSPDPDVLSLSITAPDQYPAGMPTPITAYLTLTNTSLVNATNLYYEIPQSTNYTGVNITVENGSNQPCLNIDAGQSCTFPVIIDAYAHPGSFTVTATPNGTLSTSFISKVKSFIGIQSNTLSLTANIGLTDIPVNNNSGVNGISFLYQNTLVSKVDTTTLVSIVAVVQSASAGEFNTINLTDENGNLLDFKVLSGNSGVDANVLVPGSIVTFLLTIPANTTQYKFYAQTKNGNATPDQGNTAYPISLVSNNIGVLQVQPTAFALFESYIESQSYKTQVITYTNISRTPLTALQISNSDGIVHKESSTCTDVLAAGASCFYTVKLNSESGASGSGQISANYNNGQDNVTTNSQYTFYVPFWKLITGESGQPTLSFKGDSIYGNATPDEIITVDAMGYLWFYQDKKWTQLTSESYIGGGQVLGAPTMSNLLFKANTGELWTYKNKVWTQIAVSEASDGKPGSSGLGGFSENATADFFVVSDYSTYPNATLWEYVNGMWHSLTGDSGQPAQVQMLSKALPTPNAIVIYDTAGDIWSYNGTAWTNLTVVGTPPNPTPTILNAYFYGGSDLSSILYTPPINGSYHDLWWYNGSVWAQLNTGGSAPSDVGTIFGVPTTNTNLVIRDNSQDMSFMYKVWTYNGSSWTNMTDGNGITAPDQGWMVYGNTFTISQFFLGDYQQDPRLWMYDAGSWTKLSGGESQPPTFSFAYGNPTPTSIVVTDMAKDGDNSAQNIWVYDGISWVKTTGNNKPNEPVNLGNAGMGKVYGNATPNSIVTTVININMETYEPSSQIWIGRGTYTP